MRLATPYARAAAPRATAPAQAARRAPRLSLARPIGNQAMLRRKPCDDAATCAKPAEGNPGDFAIDAGKVEDAQRDAQKKAPAGSDLAKVAARNGERAVHFEAILKAHAIPLRPEVSGFFINSAMAGGAAGGQTTRCKFFPGGSPGAPPAPDDKFCVQLPPEKEDLAKTLDGKSPLSEDDKADVAEILRIGTHEMEHARFDTIQTDKAKRTIGPEKDCDLDTPVGKVTVEFMLTEIAAETSEFPVFYKNIAGQKARTTALLGEERFMAYEGGESILGAIKPLRCACPCTSVDNFVVKTVDDVTKDWPADQLLAFKQAMTRILPSYWPKTLQRKE